MAKPLVVSEILSPSINMHTSDGSGSVILDQGAINPAPVVKVMTNLFSKGISLTSDPTTEFKLDGGNIFLMASNGNVTSSSGGTISEHGAFVRQSMLIVDRLPTTVDPGAPVYDQFDNGSCPGINELSRVNVVPDVGGTVINSIITDPGNPNRDGQEIWFQNLGTVPTQTLTFTDLSVAGTLGGLIRAPVAAYVVRAGGGVSIMFDATVDAPNGQWLIRDI